MRVLTLTLLLCGCELPPLSPEHLYERIGYAEFFASKHANVCDPAVVVPAPDVACLAALPETHSPEVRCHAIAAEDYQRCVTCCGCVPDDSACERAYAAAVSDCGAAEEVEVVLAPCRN